MGACCGAPKDGSVGPAVGGNTPIKRQAGQELTLHGDYFSSEVRTIVAGLQYCGVTFVFKEVNTLVGQHKDEPYLAVNPTGSVPTLVDGNTSVIGGYSTFLTYLASTYPTLGKTLYPDNAQDEIDAHLLWYQCIFSPAT